MDAPGGIRTLTRQPGNRLTQGSPTETMTGVDDIERESSG